MHFDVQLSDAAHLASGSPHYPKGGHNYYGRDLEKLGRSMNWIDAASKGELDWEKRYIKYRDKWELKWSKKIRA